MLFNMKKKRKIRILEHRFATSAPAVTPSVIHVVHYRGLYNEPEMNSVRCL